MKQSDNYNLLEPIVLRVGVYNNFNFTDAEFEAIDSLVGKRYIPFVNSNSFITIKDTLPSVITVNPYLATFVEPKGDLENVKACRIKIGVCSVNSKWHEAVVNAMTWCSKNSIPCLFTFQRFISRNSMAEFTYDSDAYTFRGSYFRLTSEAKNKLVAARSFD